MLTIKSFNKGKRGKKMDIIKMLNQRLSFDEEEICYGGEEKIKKVLSESPVILPEDYIEFLLSVSGDGNYGISFPVDEGGEEIVIWSAETALLKKYEDFNLPFYKEFLEHAWLLGDDLGDFVYFYGEGTEGFGIYRGSAGSLNFNNAAKIANSLTDFLVNGTGIDVAITL